MTWRGVKAVLYRVVPFLAFWYFQNYETDLDKRKALSFMIFGVFWWSIGPLVQAKVENK
jgi:hypothetical protein